MKAILFSMMMMSTSLVFAQGAIFSTVDKAPDVLELDINSKGFSHIEKTNGRMSAMVKTELAPHLYMFQNHLLKSTLDHISCDADVSLEKDARNMQVIYVKAIRVCLDEDGLVVAHSLGLAPLTPEQGKASMHKILAKRERLAAPVSINQTEVRKETKSMSLPGLAEDGVSSSAQ